MDEVTNQAMETAREIKAFFHHIKLEKLQQLHESESLGDRNQQLEQEQTQEEPAISAPLINEEEEEEEEEDMFASPELISSVLEELDEDEEFLDPSEFQQTSDLFQ